MRWTLIGVALLALGVVPPTAEAKPRDKAEQPAAKSNRVAVLPIDFEGDMPEAWRQKMSEELIRGLVRAGFDTVPPDVVQKESGIESCDNDKCLNYISEAVGARYVVRSRIKVTDKDYDLQADVLDSEDGSLIASSTESCDLCGAAEVADLIAAQATSLQQKLQSLALGPALYTFNSEPPGAQVFIDGKLIGTTPVEFEVRPGEHQAEAVLDGYLVQTRTVTAVKGVREELDFSLQPIPADAATDKRRRAMRISGAALVGVGVAALAAGVTFLVLDERPYESDCSGDNVDGSGNCRQRYNTLVHGAALTAVGGVSLGTGIGLLVAGRKRKGGATGTQARIGLSPRGVVLVGRF